MKLIVGERYITEEGSTVEVVRETYKDEFGPGYTHYVREIKGEWSDAYAENGNYFRKGPKDPRDIVALKETKLVNYEKLKINTSEW